MSLDVSSIATPELVYCTDVFDSDSDVGLDFARKAVGNILKANLWDSIPLRNSGGDVRRIARRRLHKGIEDHVFILDLDECATMSKDSSILSALLPFCPMNITFFWLWMKTTNWRVSKFESHRPTGGVGLQAQICTT